MGMDPSYPADMMLEGANLPSNPPGSPLADISPEERKEIARLRSTSELYDRYFLSWAFFLASHEGGPRYKQGKDQDGNDLLMRHQREFEDDYKDRLKRAHYTNYSEPVCSFFTDYIFQETIDRNGGNQETFFQQFIQDVNRKGQRIDDFFKEVCDAMQIFGMTYLLVDTPSLPADRKGKRLSVREEEQLKFRPYVVSVSPLEVLDWVTDDFDNFEYLKRQQKLERWTGVEKIKVERYWEYDLGKKQIKVSDVDVTVEGKEKLIGDAVLVDFVVDQIPFIPVRYRRSKVDPFMGVSFLADIAPSNLEIFRLTSLLDEFLYRQCFNLLAMQSAESIPMREQEEGDVGTANVLTYPIGVNKPEYIAPDVKVAGAIEAERSRQIEAIYRRASQDVMNELAGGGGSSGFSQHVNFSKTVPKIATRAEVLEAAEVAMMQLVMKYKGKTWDGKIKYKDRYEITNVADMLTHLETALKNLQLESPTFFKSQLKRFVHEFDGKLPADVLKTIEAEIEQIDTKEVFNTYKLELLGRAALAPEAGASFSPSQTAGTEATVTSSQAQKTDDKSRRAPKATSPTRSTPSTATAKAESTKQRKSGR